MKKLTIAFIAALTIFVSCKKDSDDAPDNSSSRDIRYEITGNFTGSFFASYTTAAGGTANDQVTTLPWSKDITYAKNVTAAIISVNGNGGVAGQTLTVTIKRGGKVVGTPTQVPTSASGSISQSAPVVVF